MPDVEDTPRFTVEDVAIEVARVSRIMMNPENISIGFWETNEVIYRLANGQAFIFSGEEIVD